MVVPYTEGLSKIFKSICNKHAIKVYFKGVNTNKTLLMATMDKDIITGRSEVIYRHKGKKVIILV